MPRNHITGFGIACRSSSLSREKLRGLGGRRGGGGRSSLLSSLSRSRLGGGEDGLKRLAGACGGEGSRRRRGGSGDWRLGGGICLSAAGPVGSVDGKTGGGRGDLCDANPKSLSAIVSMPR